MQTLAIIDRPTVRRPSAQWRRGEAQDRVRLAHRASSVPPWTCRSCGQSWPCEARLHLDEVSPQARQRYAAQVHADWLAGTPTPRTVPRIPTSA
jgi:hypothetical protein